MSIIKKSFAAHFAAVIFSALLSLALPLSSFAGELTPAIGVLSNQISFDISGIAGNEIAFSESGLTDLFGCRMIKGLKILSLPEPDKGKLLFDGNPLKIGDTVAGRDIEKMSFSPEVDSPFDTEFSVAVLLGKNEYEIKCRVVMLEKLNFAPRPDEGASEVSVFSDVCYYGSLSAVDPEGDSMTFEITSYPRKGLIKLLDDSGGEYVYYPIFSCDASDSFEFRVKDEYGNCSEVSRVDITLSKLKNTKTYSDMRSDKDEYAATLLAEKGIFKGETVDGKLLFFPDKEVSKTEFLMMASAIAKDEYPGVAAKSENEPCAGDTITLSEALAIVERSAPSSDVEVLFAISPEEPEYKESPCEATPFYPTLHDDRPLSRRTAARIIANYLLDG